METPLPLPFIRWADTVRVAAGGRGAFERRLYDHELVYVLEGRGSLVLDGYKYALAADSVFLVKPRVWHSFLADAGEGQRLLGVHFDWDWEDAEHFDKFFAAQGVIEEALFRVPRDVAGWDARERPVLELGGRPRVARMLEDVVTEYGRGDLEARQVAGALLAATFGQIGREVRLLREVQCQMKVGADAVRRVQRAREWLEAPREASLSIEEVAARVGWSADHLRRMFRSVLGSAPAQVQTAARLRRARELLRYGALPIGEIARRCGFEDASHFARVFKRELGCTPREWAVLVRVEQNDGNGR